MSTTQYANDIITQPTVIVAMQCPVCGLVYGLDQGFREKRLEDGRDWHCPNGHCLAFTDSEVDRLRQRLEQQKRWTDGARAQATHERDQRRAAERSARAYKGQVTKIRRRVGNGVCPCCNRSFADLGRHMAGQHPDYAGGDR